MGPIGMQEMIFIVILALLLFGPKKLPELARLLGKGMSEFRRAKNELKSTFDTHLQELERETRMDEARKNPPAQYTPSYSPYSYVPDELPKSSAEYSYPSEPPVELHANGNTPVVEAPQLPPVPAVVGTVPRSALVPVPHHEHQDEHPA